MGVIAKRSLPGGRALGALDADLDGEDGAMSAEELREFLAGDLLPGEADPEFREQLRGKLWAMVQARYGRPGSSQGGNDA